MKEEKYNSVYMVKYHSYTAWYKGMKFHREDGPAIEYTNGNKEWFFNGLRHREDGPAVERTDGVKYWWLYGESLTKENWLEKLPEDLKIKALFNEFFMLG
jgi:hypothetical protein